MNISLRICAFTSALFVIAASAVATQPPRDEEKVDPSAPRFVSPDGRYGLLVTDDRVELIEVTTRRSLVVLSDPERPERSEEARLDWSKDSQMVAAYTATRMDGSTRLFTREGDSLVEVKLPELPELPDPESNAAFRKKHKFRFRKWINTGSLEFVRWLKSGEVELKSYNEVATAEGGGFRAQINAIIAIDSKHHATLKKVVREEKFE